MARPTRLSLTIAALILLLLPAAAGAQGPPAPGAQGAPSLQGPAAPDATVQGWLSVVWSDNPAERVSRQRLFLHLDDGRSIELRGHDRVRPPRRGWKALAGRRVEIRIPASESDRLALPGTRTAFVTSIAAIGAAPGDPEIEAAVGSNPWITIPCKFSDVAAEPKTLTYFRNMYAVTRPGLDHYWREVSYGLTDLAGSDSVNWLTLPEPRSTYITAAGADLDRLVDDCTALADPAVDFRQFTGINLMFNTDLDGFAHGGNQYLTLDGARRLWMVTWEPPWGYGNVAVIAHEMGHGLGLPHSSGPYGEVYDSPWDVMSDTWANCSRATDPTYGCLPQHTIAPYKNESGWIAAERQYALAGGATATITLEGLSAPGAGNYLLARTPALADGTYYTVEARRRTGYDSALRADGVVIHKFDPTAGGFAGYYAYVVDGDGNGVTDDLGTVWSPGEIFTDAAAAITISIGSATATGFVVTLSHASGVTLSSLTPTGGATTGGRAVTLHGSGFTAGATVTFGGSSGSNVSVVNSSTITVTTPAHAAGLVDVRVDCGGSGSATLASAFLYGPAPDITAVSPPAGPLGGTTLTIGGSGFITDGLTVTVGGVAASGVQLVSGTQLTAVAPASGVYSVAAVTVTTRTGSASMSNGFTYYPPASNFSASPGVLPLAGGTTVTLSASYLVPGMTTLAVGGSAVAITGITSSSLTFVAPPHAAGPVSLAITTPGGGATFTNGLYYADAPTIASVSPRLVSARGGTTVAVTGTNFIAGITAFVYCDTPVAATPVSATSATFTTVACPPGVRALSARNGSWQVSTTMAVAAGGRGDYDGDLTPDITVYRPSSGTWFSLRSDTGFTDYAFRGWGLAGDVPASGDFDGDLTDDLVVFRPSTGTWFILESSGANTTWRHFGWGNATDILVPGDYDGDGTTDAAVFRPSTGTWHIRRSAPALSPLAIVFGAASDTPVPADYDGDGRMDIAVYRPSSGTWFVLTSSSSFQSWTYRGWGVDASGDQPVPGDFDGDGKADYTVFRPSAGTWFYLKSSVQNGWDYFGWGAVGDRPLAVDFDGDGTADAAVFRPSTGEWFVRPSGGATPWNVTFGQGGDIAIR